MTAGSFRNAPFWVESADGDLGRRVALHEYPLRDTPFAEDLGRKARSFSLEFFVVGPEYMGLRDRLIKALETAGPGKLVHPYQGEMQVVVLEARGPRESTREGGMARFAVTFVLAGEAIYPSGAADQGQVVKTKATLASAAIQREFVQKFAVTRRPAWLGSAAITLVRSVTSQIREISMAITNLPANALQFVDDLEAMSAAVEELIRTPATLGLAIYDLIGRIALLPDRPQRAIAAYQPLFTALADAPAVPGATALRKQQAANQEALAALTQRAAIVEASRAAADAQFESLDEAIATRDQLVELLDVQMLTAGDDTYATMAGLRAELVRYVATSAGDLARLVTYVPPVTVPALVIAHRLYGDASREAEIIVRNHFPHPGFVRGGQAIEVLTDA